MQSKVCSRCKLEKSVNYFGKNKAKADGLVAYCKVCRNAMSAEKYASNNHFKEKTKNRTLKTITQSRKDPAIKKQHAEASKRWQQNNPGYGRASQARKKATKLQRTPFWSETSLISKFYAACPIGYEVDHIVPLVGDKYGVCGLHVLSNLQYLTVEENSKKSNRWSWELQK